MRAGSVCYRRAEDRVDRPSGAGARDGGLPVVEVGLAQGPLLLVELPQLAGGTPRPQGESADKINMYCRRRDRMGQDGRTS